MQKHQSAIHRKKGEAIRVRKKAAKTNINVICRGHKVFAHCDCHPVEESGGDIMKLKCQANVRKRKYRGVEYELIMKTNNRVIKERV